VRRRRVRELQIEYSFLEVSVGFPLSLLGLECLLQPIFVIFLNLSSRGLVRGRGIRCRGGRLRLLIRGSGIVTLIEYIVHQVEQRGRD
jgi:hypothetical protein